MYQFNKFCYGKVIKGVLIKRQILLTLTKAYYLNNPAVRILMFKKNHSAEVIPNSFSKSLTSFQKESCIIIAQFAGGVE